MNNIRKTFEERLIRFKYTDGCECVSMDDECKHHRLLRFFDEALLARDEEWKNRVKLLKLLSSVDDEACQCIDDLINKMTGKGD